MALKKIIAVLIFILAVLAGVFIFWPSTNNYFLYDQENEITFEQGDTIYAQLDKPDVVLISIDSSEQFIPEYVDADTFVISSDLSPGQHRLDVFIGGTVYQQTITVEKGLNIFDFSTDSFVPFGADAILQLSIAGFETQTIEEGTLHWITYDLSVYDEQGVKVNEYSETNEHLGPERSKVILAIPLETRTAKLQTYTAKIKVTDQLTKQSDEKEVSFSVI